MPLTLDAQWLGRRVSVRRAVGREESGRLAFADVVGDLIALHSDIAVVEARGGPVEVPIGHVVAARVVEPSTADILALERVAARGWRAQETAWLGGKADGWLLRANGGLTWRANSVLPLHAPGVELTDALQEAGRWYAEHGQPLRLQLPLQARSLLDGELGERGFDAVQPDVHVLVARLDMLPERPVDSDTTVELAEQPAEDWLRLYSDDRAVRELLTRHHSVRFAAIRQDGQLVAIARGAVDEGWLGLSALRVAETHRRRGLGGALVARLEQWGVERGARRSYVQVSGSNEPSLSLFTGLGYWHHHDYRYRYLAAGEDVSGATPTAR